MPLAPHEPRSSCAASDTVPIIAEAEEVSWAGQGRPLAGTALEARAGAPPAYRRPACRSTRIEGGVYVAELGSASNGSAPGLRPTYRVALFRLAQDALILFDMAFLAVALHGFRFRFVLG